ncbi:MAG TPA: MFS transporter [Verrucomicrobiae bacterium]|nr:MFS transporter [Verrucomicrobiae bacterium]
MRVTSFASAMDTCKMAPLHWKVFVFAALGIFMDGYDFFIVAAALPLIAEYWHPVPAVLGLVGAAATVGAVFGGAVLGRYADILGRRKMAMLTMAIFAVISIASGAAWSIVALIAIRFALGVAIGADYPTGAAYVAEFMPLTQRPRLLFASLSFQALGAVAGAFIGLHVIHTHNLEVWRLLFAMGVVPALLILLLRGQLPESPRWLYAKGRLDDARRVLEQLTCGPVELAIDTAGEPEQLPFSALFSPRFLRRTIFVTVPWFCMDVALYGMALFTPVILASAGFGHAKDTFWSRDIHALRGALWLDVVLVVGFVLGIALVRRAGALRLQIVGFAGMVAGLGVAALGNAGGQNWLLFAGFALFNLCVNAGPNGTTYLIAAVEFPTNLRATASGLATAAGKIGASVGIFLMPIMQAAWGIAATIAVVAAVALAGLAVTLLLRGEFVEGGRTLARVEPPLTEAQPA